MSLFLPVFAVALALAVGGFVAFLLFLVGYFAFRIVTLATDGLLLGEDGK